MKRTFAAFIGTAVLASPLFASALSVSEIKDQISGLVSQITSLQAQLKELRAMIALPPACAVAFSPKETTLGTKVKVVWNSRNAVAASWVPDTSGKDNLPVPAGTPGLTGSAYLIASVSGQPSLTLEVANQSGVTNRCTGTLKVNGSPTSCPVYDPIPCSGTLVSQGVDANGCQLPLICVPGTASSTVSLSVDASSPSYQTVAAGSSGVVVGVYKLRASGENYTLSKLGLTAVRGSYGSSSTGSGGGASVGGDVTQVSLYSAGGALLGTAIFAGLNQTATSALANPLLLKRDVDTTIIVKADMGSIGVAQPGGIANLITIDPLNYEATGETTGSTVRGAGVMGVAGVRVFRSFPTFALDALPSTGIVDGRLMRFKVSANAAGGVGFKRFAFQIAPTSVSLSNIALYAYADPAYSQAIAGQGIGGKIGTTVPVASTSPGIVIYEAATPLEVPAGTTYYFELRATVAGAGPSSLVMTQLLTDADPPAPALGYNARPINALPIDHLVWSGNSTTTSQPLDVDWFNGYGVPGLSSTAVSQARVAVATGAAVADADPGVMSQLGNVLAALASLLASFRL